MGSTATASESAFELKGIFEGVVGTAIVGVATYAFMHFTGLVGMEFLPPEVGEAIHGAASGAADLIRNGLSWLGVGLPFGGTPLEMMNLGTGAAAGAAAGTATATAAAFNPLNAMGVPGLDPLDGMMTLEA